MEEEGKRDEGTQYLDMVWEKIGIGTEEGNAETGMDHCEKSERDEKVETEETKVGLEKHLVGEN